MRRGFKAEAERLAAELRDEMGLAEDAPVLPARMAAHMGVELVAADSLVDRSRLEELQQIQDDAFSAATFQLPDGRTVVVTNPLNGPARTNSDIAHELAHLLLEHELGQVERVGDVDFFTCDAEQEEEANWLAGCLLLPRSLVLRAAWKEWDPERIATEHQVSVAMARFRLNASGVLIQVARARKKRRQ